MTFALTIEPEAEAEIVEATVWYDEHGMILRERFIAAVGAALTAIRLHLYQYQVVYDNVRRIMVERFPYALMYVISGQDVYVVACIHCSRDPKRWQDRSR